MEGIHSSENKLENPSMGGILRTRRWCLDGNLSESRLKGERAVNRRDGIISTADESTSRALFQDPHIQNPKTQSLSYLHLQIHRPSPPLFLSCLLLFLKPSHTEPLIANTHPFLYNLVSSFALYLDQPQYLVKT